MAAFLRSWLEGKQRLRASTAVAYGIHVDRHIVPVLGGIALGDLSLDDLRTFYTGLRSQGLSAASVQRIHATLSSALTAAVRQGLLEVSPAAWVELPEPVAAERSIWSFGEAQRFLAGIRGDSQEAVFRLLLLAGLRRGEVLGLRWRDLDLDQQLLTVRQQVVQVGGQLVINPPKSKRGARTVSIDQDTVDLLHRHRDQRADRYELVFCAAAGAPPRPASVSRRFERIVTDLGLPLIRLHDLRHTSASLGLAAGESLVEVSRRLGHSSVTVTGDIYSHLDPSLTRASADRLARHCMATTPTDDAEVVSMVRRTGVR